MLAGHYTTALVAYQKFPKGTLLYFLIASQLQDLAEDMPVALNDVYIRVQNMKAVLPVSNIEDFKILNQQLNGSVVNLNSTNLDISNNSIIRRI